jgi:hypothetical protein
MLPQFYRIIAVNNTGQTLTFNNNGRINVKMTGWFITPATGLINYAPLPDDDCSFGAGDSTADGSEDKSDEIDNTGNLYLGLQVQLEITHNEGTAADGTYDLYLDGGDASGELASDATGYAGAEANRLQLIGSLTWEPNGLDDEVMRSEVINI